MAIAVIAKSDENHTNENTINIGRHFNSVFNTAQS